MPTSQFDDLATKGVRQLKPYVAGMSSEELARKLNIHEAVKLASNENPLGASKKVIKKLRDNLEYIYLYPDSDAYTLRYKIANYLDVDVEQITLGNGSNEVLEIIARTFASSNDSIIYSRHGFIVYSIITQAIGAQSIIVDTLNWQTDISKIVAKINKNTKLIFIANPNNPTGSWITHDELNYLLEHTPKSCFIVIDEAYHEYTSPQNVPNALNVLEHFDNLIVTRTFSKIYGLAGLRVGYSISHPKVAELLNRVREPFNVNCLAQYAAVTALQEQQHIHSSKAINDQGMVQLREGIERLGLVTIPSQGNFISFALPGDGKNYFEALLHKGYIVRPLHIYEMPNYLRVTIGKLTQNEGFLKALAQVL